MTSMLCMPFTLARMSSSPQTPATHPGPFPGLWATSCASCAPVSWNHAVSGAGVEFGDDGGLPHAGEGTITGWLISPPAHDAAQCAVHVFGAGGGSRSPAIERSPPSAPTNEPIGPATAPTDAPARLLTAMAFPMVCTPSPDALRYACVRFASAMGPFIAGFAFSMLSSATPIVTVSVRSLIWIGSASGRPSKLIVLFAALVPQFDRIEFAPPLPSVHAAD
jgi:hypothetical protein